MPTCAGRLPSVHYAQLSVVAAGRKNQGLAAAAGLTPASALDHPFMQLVVSQYHCEGGAAGGIAESADGNRAVFRGSKDTSAALMQREDASCSARETADEPKLMLREHATGI